MIVEFIAHDDEYNVLASWDMPMPPRKGETVTIGKDNYAVGWSEYVQHDGEVAAMTTVRLVK